MDGPAVASGGGLEIGSGYVAVTVQIDEALQRLGVLKQAMADVTSMPMNIGGGGGSAFGGHAPMPAGGNPMGWQGLPSPSMPTAQQAQGFHGIPTPSGGGGSHQPAGGGHTHPHEHGHEWGEMNLHRLLHHFMTRTLGIPMAGVEGAMLIGNAIQGQMESAYLASHPNPVVEPFYQYGSGLGMYANTEVQQLAQQSLSNRQALARFEPVTHIPLLGEAINAFGGEYYKFKLEQQNDEYKERTADIKSSAELARQVRVADAAATFNPVDIARARYAEEERGPAEEAAQRQRHLEQKRRELEDLGAEQTVSQFQGARYNTGEGSAAAGATPGDIAAAAHNEQIHKLREEITNLAKEADESSEKLKKLREDHARMVAEEVRVQETQFRSGVAGAQSGVYHMLAAQGYLNPDVATMEAQKAELGAVATNALGAFAAHPNRGTFGQMIGAMGHLFTGNAALDAQQDDTRTRLGIQTRAAQARGGMEDFRAQQLEYDAQLVGPLTPEQKGLIGANKSAASQRASFEGDLANFQTANSAEQATLRGNRQFNEAALQDIAAGTANQVLQLDPSGPRYQQRREALYGLGQAQTAAAVTEQQFNIKQNIASFGAREQAANYQAGYMTNAAQATMDVQRAQHEVAMANTPEERAAAISASRAELQSHAHLLTDQRGGNQAIMMRGSEALGSVSARGVDITEHLKDIREAQKIYGKGAEAGGLEKVAEDANKIDTKTLNAAIAKFNQIMSKWERNAQKWGSPPGV